ncbi:Bug family tripartite tricarboxylate transporter substrate binding protein [Arthrobacter sp. H14-L1]|uniref:Bug family tripartite tricarboxylate transporter substrate binding protein n=1 Tax=Arthrobacter sp. H14-L1 TaxID=2996697 RepID=UPI002271CBD5|nr:tripartite tricarboxylate transporter substrate binding protein [Arthrobacter sp. H14-L1]MCY0904417.1 tripartite tricarboxylate transporter substrate binding protein [Arthrobacter sp. H14-L1]
MRLSGWMKASLLLLVLALTGCGLPGPSMTDIRMMVPNSPGGGYDITARIAARTMEDSGATGHMEIFNVTGAGGSVALARLINESGNPDLMMMMGLGVVGSGYANGSKDNVSDATALAELIEEQEAILVRSDSPYKSIGDLLQAWKSTPSSVTVGGGSAPGGPDQLFPMELARVIGVPTNEVHYSAYAGGGELLPALLNRKVSFGTSGLAEYRDQIASGQLRILAVSGRERHASITAPTLRESGINLVFTNWRGVLAPPGITPSDRQRLLQALDRLHESPAWKQALLDNGWDDAYKTGDTFSAFLKEQDATVAATLKELGIP